MQIWIRRLGFRAVRIIYSYVLSLSLFLVSKHNRPHKESYFIVPPWILYVCHSILQILYLRDRARNNKKPIDPDPFGFNFCSVFPLHHVPSTPRSRIHATIGLILMSSKSKNSFEANAISATPKPRPLHQINWQSPAIHHYTHASSPIHVREILLFWRCQFSF